MAGRNRLDIRIMTSMPIILMALDVASSKKASTTTVCWSMDFLQSGSVTNECRLPDCGGQWPYGRSFIADDLRREPKPFSSESPCWNTVRGGGGGTSRPIFQTCCD